MIVCVIYSSTVAYLIYGTKLCNSVIIILPSTYSLCIADGKLVGMMLQAVSLNCLA